MRPVSIALGGVFALILTDAALAAPLNPQPLPPGRHANAQQPPPGRQPAPTYFVACVSRKPGAEHGQTAAAPRGPRGGAGKVQTACASGRGP